jgi:hypothetical protein
MSAERSDKSRQQLLAAGLVQRAGIVRRGMVAGDPARSFGWTLHYKELKYLPAEPGGIASVKSHPNRPL